MGDPVRTSIRSYRDAFQGIGCASGCMVHMALLGVLGLALLIWAVKNRAWELEISVELPEREQVEEETPPQPPAEPAPQ
jgi:hypothetical protein